jgi:hypothetical protein
MENKNQKSNETGKPKIVNLFEDGNVHEHNQGSYEKMVAHQNNQKPAKSERPAGKPGSQK